MQRKSNTHCALCHTAMYRRPSQIAAGSVYCSSRCCGQDQQKQKICPVCQTHYVGAKKTCSHACANTARTGISYTKQNKFNKAYRDSLLKETVAKKRGGACERCGESNYAILQIHHKIERHKGGSDKLQNLELLCPNCHMSHHLGRSLFDQKKMV